MQLSRSLFTAMASDFRASSVHCLFIVESHSFHAAGENWTLVFWLLYLLTVLWRSEINAATAELFSDHLKIVKTKVSFPRPCWSILKNSLLSAAVSLSSTLQTPFFAGNRKPPHSKMDYRFCHCHSVLADIWCDLGDLTAQMLGSLKESCPPKV